MFLSAAEVRVGGCLERVGGCLQPDPSQTLPFRRRRSDQKTVSRFRFLQVFGLWEVRCGSYSPKRVFRTFHWRLGDVLFRRFFAPSCGEILQRQFSFSK